MTWAAIIVGTAGCYLLKLTGVSIPRHFLDNPRVRRSAELLPVALLTALIATQTFSTGRHLDLDARALGLAVAVVAVRLRAPFLVVVTAACAAAAVLRLLT